MIDWLNLLYNALWILALAIAIATTSWASWQASVQGTGLRKELTATGPQRALQTAGTLFSLGLGLTSTTLVERMIWFVFTAVFLVQFVSTFRNASGTR